MIVALNIAVMSEALALATKAGVNPDLVYQALRVDGHGNDDHSALVCYYEKLAKVEVTH